MDKFEERHVSCKIKVLGKEYDATALIGESSFHGKEFWVAKIEVDYTHEKVKNPSGKLTDFPPGSHIGIICDDNKNSTGCIVSLGGINAYNNIPAQIFVVGISLWA